MDENIRDMHQIIGDIDRQLEQELREYYRTHEEMQTGPTGFAYEDRFIADSLDYVGENVVDWARGEPDDIPSFDFDETHETTRTGLLWVGSQALHALIREYVAREEA